MLTPGCEVNSTNRGILKVSCWDRCWQYLGPMMCGQGLALELHQPAALMGTSKAGQKLKGCETTLPSAFTGHRRGEAVLSLQPPTQSLPLQVCRSMSKSSAYGKAMISEKQYSAFVSGALGYSFVNGWSMLQLKPSEVLLTSEVRCRRIAFTRPQMANLCCLPYPLCIVKSSDLDFISLLLVIFPRCNVTKTKLARSRVPKKIGHLHKNRTRVEYFGSFLMCIRKSMQ